MSHMVALSLLHLARTRAHLVPVPADRTVLSRLIGYPVSCQRIFVDNCDKRTTFYCYQADLGVPDEAFMHVYAVTDHRKIRRIDCFSDLRGLIAISSQQQALDLAHLRTGHDSWFLFKRRDIEVDVLDGDEDVPEFGLSNSYSSFMRSRSGTLGILSGTAYRQGDFTPPKVTAIGTGYIVSRWLFVSEGPTYRSRQFLEYVSEKIDFDGADSVRIVKKEPLPNLKDTEWKIPSFD